MAIPHLEDRIDERSSAGIVEICRLRCALAPEDEPQTGIRARVLSNKRWCTVESTLEISLAKTCIEKENFLDALKRRYENMD
jgi:hypothetical protein